MSRKYHDIWRPPWGKAHRWPETHSGREPVSFPVSAASLARPMALAPMLCRAWRPPALRAPLTISSAEYTSPTSSESCLVDLLGKVHIANELASDLESVGSTDPPVEMIIDSDAVDVDAYPDHVEIIDDPLPRVDSITGASTVT